MKTLWQQVLVAMLIALCSGSIGFGASQMLIVSEVRKSANDIVYLKESDVMIRKELSDEHGRTDQRIFTLAGMVTKIIDQNSEVINLVKVQNELLTREKR